jgi:hypothetical protein
MNSDREFDEVRLINRREAIRRVSVLLGGAAFVGGTGLLAAVESASAPAASGPAAGTPASSTPAVGTPDGNAATFSAADIALLDEIAETILPQTQTPGAKAGHAFREGLRHVDEAARQANNVSFMAATPAQRLAVLTTLDHEQKRIMDAREAAGRKPEHDPPPPYFRMMKELALLGYFTSEIGCTQAQRYVESPGRFDACIPYTAGEPAWASHA